MLYTLAKDLSSAFVQLSQLLRIDFWLHSSFIDLVKNILSTPLSGLNFQWFSEISLLLSLSMCVLSSTATKVWTTFHISCEETSGYRHNSVYKDRICSPLWKVEQISSSEVYPNRKVFEVNLVTSADSDSLLSCLTF